jgi:hypothetical protein
VIAVFALFFGSVREVQAGVVEAKKDAKICRDLPAIKNLTGLKAQHVCEGMSPKELTKSRSEEARRYCGDARRSPHGCAALSR